MKPRMQQLSLAICFGLAAASATAEPATHQFDIPPQALGTALQALANQSGAQMLYSESLMAGKHSQGLSGSYTTEQAVEKLLAGSGLTPKVAESGTVTITPAASQLNQANPTSLPPVKVVGKAEYDATDPYNEDYVLPNATAGTKTDTPIMETPLNVQVVSKQVLKDQQVITLGDALKNVSGVTVNAASSSGDYSSNSGTASNITLRGFTSQTYFRNGFRLLQGSSNRNMSNVENVEVLKGPAAILYGLIEPGGMVNVVTKQPLATPYYALGQQFGSYDNYRTTVDASGPVAGNKDVLYRMNASYQNSGSWQDFVGTENFFVAPVLKWNISSKTQVGIEFEYNRQHQVPVNPLNPYVNNQLLRLPLSYNSAESTPTTTETFLGNFNWSHQFNDDWSIKHSFLVNQLSFSAPKFSSPNAATTPDNFPLPAGLGLQVVRETVGQTQQGNTYGTNLDLTGHLDTFGLKHTLLLGGDYYRLNDSFDISLAGNVWSYIDAYHPVHPGVVVTDINVPNIHSMGQTQTDQYGLYFQDQIKLPYDLHITGGLRYQYLHQLTTSSFTVDGVPASPDTASTLIQDAVTPRVGILWHPQNWLSVYANYAESFGPNTGGLIYKGPTTSPALAPPTTGQQYEGGIKTEFFDGRLRATLAYYDLTKTNNVVNDPAHPIECGGPCSLAIGAIHSHGPELDIQGEILPGWNAIATWANTDIRILKTDANNNPIQFTDQKVGDRVFDVPRNTASFWTTYEIQDTDLKGLKFGGGVTVREGQVGWGGIDDLDTNQVGPNKKTPGYATLGLMTAYSHAIGKSKVTLQLNVDNLLDQRYFSSISGWYNTPGFSGAWAPYGAPRTVLGSINIQY